VIPLDRVRAMLAAMRPSDLQELAREEPDWGDPCAEAAPVELFIAAPDLAAQVLTLAAALETAQRERDSDRALIAALSHDHAAAVSDRDAMQRERDAARQAHAELASAVREYLDAEDGYDPSCPGGCGVVECCTREAVDAARTVLDAALAAAEGTR